ncbi:MAG: glycosyltransferase [Verrucomicrobia bacterium]|nr:glycosyltransferase [Verrucomicrobiota bacterium]
MSAFRAKNLLVPHDFEVNYAIGFARGLVANGVDLAVLSFDDMVPMLHAAGIAHHNIRGSLDPDRKVWQKAVNLARYYLRLLWTVFRYRGSTIHFTGLLTSRIILWDGLLLPFWFWLWAGTYVHTAHNVLPHSRENSRLFRWMYAWIYRFPDAIIAHTDRVAEQLVVEFGVDPAKITTISIGLNEEMPATTLSVSAARKQLGLPPDGPIALFFGKVEPYKGVDLLAEAWGLVRTPDARVVVAGWCPDEGYAKTIRAAIARSPQSATMEWREGFVPNEDVAAWLQACDAVVMPYRNIYQSGVVFLCLRFGMPIVATRVGSLHDYIDADSGVLTETNDPAGIAQALDRFFSTRDRFRRDEIARRAGKYSWDRQCLTIKHLYR